MLSLVFLQSLRCKESKRERERDRERERETERERERKRGGRERNARISSTLELLQNYQES